MTSKPNILLVGEWRWPWFQKACADALKSLGCEVKPFELFDDFYRWEPSRPEPVFKSVWARLQNRLLAGPILNRINRRLIETAKELQPDVVWFYNCIHIFPGTIRELRRVLPDGKLVQYANDNPFGPQANARTWRHLKRSIPHFDAHFVFRHSNLHDFPAVGAKCVHLLRAYYIAEEEYYVSLTEQDRRFQCDVVFAGHFEDDGRLECLDRIAREGHCLNLFGGGWQPAQKKLSDDSPLQVQFPVEPVVGPDYRKAISGARIALCFLSKINGDTYTIRNFQIPAMKTFILSEYTEDLASMFEEGVEAEYFRSPEELLDKVNYYLQNDSTREKIARQGYERLIRDGHDVVSRMRQFLQEIQNLDT